MKVVQRHTKHALDFNRPWSEYKNGFGFLGSDFWLGFERLSFLTNQKDYEIRIDIENTAHEHFYVQYNFFRISDQWSDFKLSGLGEYGGNAGNFQFIELAEVCIWGFSKLPSPLSQNLNQHFKLIKGTVGCF